jgi:hypothetical protein
MPSGIPFPRSAQTRRFDKLPSAAMLKAVSLFAEDSATIIVEFFGVMSMTLGKLDEFVRYYNKTNAVQRIVRTK